MREADFLQDARPWANYSDYRPLIEFAKAVRVPVLAANAPRRYVGAVGRTPALLAEAAWPSPTWDAWVPPLPLPPPSDAYLAHLFADPAVVRADQLGLDDEFSAANHGGADAKDGRCPYIGLASREGLLAPMLLWDAAMAHAIVRSLDAEPSRLVVHICGSFHCEKHVGVVEMVQALRGPSKPTKQLVVVFYPEKDCHQFVSERHAGRADFVVLTDASVMRSHDYMGS